MVDHRKIDSGLSHVLYIRTNCSFLRKFLLYGITHPTDKNSTTASLVRVYQTDSSLCNNIVSSILGHSLFRLSWKFLLTIFLPALSGLKRRLRGSFIWLCGLTLWSMEYWPRGTYFCIYASKNKFIMQTYWDTTYSEGPQENFSVRTYWVTYMQRCGNMLTFWHARLRCCNKLG